jgi:hypothetical protein
MGGLWPSADAPGATGDELGAGDVPAGLIGLEDGLTVSHSGPRRSSLSISTACDLREVSS